MLCVLAISSNTNWCIYISLYITVWICMSRIYPECWIKLNNVIVWVTFLVASFQWLFLKSGTLFPYHQNDRTLILFKYNVNMSEWIKKNREVDELFIESQRWRSGAIDVFTNCHLVPKFWCWYFILILEGLYDIN